MKNKKTKFIIFAIFLVFAFTVLIGNNVSAEGIYTFSDGDSEKNIAFSNKQGNEGEQCEIFYITLPSKNSVSTVNMDISGDIQQSKLDLVFILDTSGSMSGEWKDLCNEIRNIINSLQKVDTKVTIYSLNKSVGKYFNDPCGGYNLNDLSEITLEATANVDLEDKGCEAWMAGIIWASTPGNYNWRRDTIKVVIPISDETDATYKEELKNKAIDVALNNNVFVYGLWGDPGDNDTDNYMKEISEKTEGKAIKFKSEEDLSVVIDDAANKALSGLSLKVGGTEVWGHLEKMMDKQSVGGTESSAFVKALNDYSKQHCTSYPCNVPIEICSSKPVKGDLTLSNLRIAMTPVIFGPCQNLVPCKDDCKLSDIFVMIQNIVNCLVFISTIICLLFIVIGGLLYIFSLGNPENLTKAKNTILWALGGLALVFLAWLIINTVMQFMGVGGGFLMWSSVG